MASINHAWTRLKKRGGYQDFVPAVPGSGAQSNYIKEQPATFTVMVRSYILITDFRSTSQVSCWRMMRKVVVSAGLAVW
jgi:hypothetical protein